MQLSEKWLNVVSAWEKPERGYHRVEVKYMDGDKERHFKAHVWPDGTLEKIHVLQQPNTLFLVSEQQIVSIERL